MADFQIIDHGSLVGFTPLTDEASAWWEENVQDGPCLGRSRFVEHRFAGAIIEGLQAEGLI